MIAPEIMLLMFIIPISPSLTCRETIHRIPLWKVTVKQSHCTNSLQVKCIFILRNALHWPCLSKRHTTNASFMLQALRYKQKNPLSGHRLLPHLLLSFAASDHMISANTVSTCAYKRLKNLVLTMPSVISCVCWVKKGVSKEIPDQVSLILFSTVWCWWLLPRAIKMMLYLEALYHDMVYSVYLNAVA